MMILELLVSLWLLTTLALGLVVLLLPSEIVEAPILYILHWRDWRLDAGNQYYDGDHYYLWVGPLILSIEP